LNSTSRQQQQQQQQQHPGGSFMSLFGFAGEKLILALNSVLAYYYTTELTSK